jgi:hypothetical protein
MALWKVSDSNNAMENIQYLLALKIGNCQGMDNLLEIFLPATIKEMANHIITITGIESNNDLILSDDGLTTAEAGDTVTWLINGNSGVASITAITEIDGVDVFTPNPTPMNSTCWEGSINPVPPSSEVTETYTINYLKVGDATIYTSDPKIRVNP